MHDLPAEVLTVHRHHHGSFLLYFMAREDRDRVLDGQYIQSPYFRLMVKPWSRRTNATAGGLGVHVQLEIEGIPANAWSIAAAETILAPNSWVERLDPLTRTRADMNTFRLSAWSLDPSLIPKEVDFHMVEPGEPPSARAMAAPASEVVPPQVPTLIHPLIVHVTSFTDYRRRPPSSGPGGTGGDGPAPRWPARRHYSYDPGNPDSLPDGGDAPAAGLGGGGSSRSNGHRGGARHHAAGTCQPSSRRQKRRGRKATAAANAGDVSDDRTLVGASDASLLCLLPSGSGALVEGTEPARRKRRQRKRGGKKFSRKGRKEGSAASDPSAPVEVGAATQLAPAQLSPAREDLQSGQLEEAQKSPPTPAAVSSGVEVGGDKPVDPTPAASPPLSPAMEHAVG
jgi:hypothetical protein